MEFDLSKLTVANGCPELGLAIINGDVVADSLVLAKVFKKQHKNVLQDIDNQLLIMSEEFSRLNFQLREYQDSRGKKQRKYSLTFKGFTKVAMRYEGPLANQYQEAYINMFDEMFKLLSTRKDTKEGYKEMTRSIRKNLKVNDYTYAIEADLVNKAVFGKTSKELKREKGVRRYDNVRDMLNDIELNIIDKAQEYNAMLISSGFSEKQRFEAIEKIFKAA